MAHNKIGIRTDKPSYIEGEVVTGQIKCQITSPVECKSVVLKVKGYEKVEWDEEEAEQKWDGENVQVTWERKEIKKKKEFFKQTIVVSAVESVLPPGEWSYPFSYQLPAQLPGVFEEKRHLGHGNTGELKFHAAVVYKVKATVDVTGVFAKDLKATQKLVVNERVETAIQPQWAKKKGSVMFLCCINKGDVELGCVVDKNAYAAGEVVQCTARIENQSTSDIEHMKVVLVRFMEFQADKHKKVFVENILEAKHPGVGPKQTVDRQLPLQLAVGLHPQVKSQFIHCHYQLHVECDVPYAPDIEVHIPVVIYAPQPASWGVWF